MEKILERRHGMVHRVEIDADYSTQELDKDIKDVKVALKRVCLYICKQHNWEPEEIII